MSIERLQELEREIARLYAVQAEVLVQLASTDRVVDSFVLVDEWRGDERRIRIEDAVREEVAASMRWSPSTAQARIDQARLLAGPLGNLRDALASGEISPRHVAVIVEAASRLPGAIDRFRRGPDGCPDARALAAEAEFAAACGELQRRVLPTARRSTVARTRQATRRAVLAIDADGQHRRHLQARCTRDVYVADGLDGLSTLVARLATEDAHAVMALVGAVACGSNPEQRGDQMALTVGERRAEALSALVLGGRDSRAVQARIDLVVDLPTLLGLAERPGELASAGTGAVTVPADAIRAVLADPRIDVSLRRLVSDPVAGHVLDVGRRCYEVSDRMRAFLVARDGTCRFPGCARRADGCQVDHATAWEDGGGTDAANLGALCVRHHQLKTHAGWDIVRSHRDGSCIWRSPGGRIFEHPPRPILHSERELDPQPPPASAVSNLADPPPL
jgi:hypothetical protein